ncbi:Sulfatase [Phytophthora infestans]|uniref:Sulfatase n=1 Tax=Phytophthora infestans TaxID=4787 RepID=A0A833WMD7_PHYIN|nr:Sulfatase [Phytophthora infestans]
MESQRLVRAGTPTLRRLPSPPDVDDELDHDLSDTPKKSTTRRRRFPTELVQIADVIALPWFGWFFVYAFTLFCFSVSRSVVLKSLATMYGSPRDYTASFKAAALGLGTLEDFVCTTYLACALWLFDTLKLTAIERFSSQVHALVVRVVGNIATFTVSWILFVLVVAPFAADMLLVLNRDMRFTLDLVATLIRERHHLGHAPISSEEFQRAYTVGGLLVTAATVFALIRTWAGWADLTLWNPTHMVVLSGERAVTGKVFKRAKYKELALEEGQEGATVQEEQLSSVTDSQPYGKVLFNRVIQATALLVALVVAPMIVVAVRCASSPLVAYSALNATLNELFGHALQPGATESTFSNDSDLPWMEMYIHPTERHKLYGNDSLYRRTTGFRGDLAFDVDISKDNPPNVLVLGVESFRFRDSRYFVGENDPSNVFKGTQLTVTPNFDRWAKRGVAIRNLWTSNPTSRSLESALFAQIPYDSAVKTGITGGREDTELSGVPQLFLSKGYETYFTTGSSIDLDNWNVFLPSHGYETVWDNNKIKELAENHLNISHEDWNGVARRGFQWGAHDDVSFQILGDLLVNKTRNQTEQVWNGKKKTPLFITHYTITSHSPYNSVPKWYNDSKKPDFSALYEGEKHASLIKPYLEARYFTDVELGKFLDRMDQEGVLDNTIVVIYGDHGQAPEGDIIYTEEESLTRVPCLILAEGRLGKYAGLKLEDAAEHYDILNTLADITGLPEGGFVQNGVGRSLKRKVTFGERAVFSNVPGHKMSVVRGHYRLRYDGITDAMFLHNTETDHWMNEDLLPELPPEKLAEWETWRDSGRRISAYYTKRWDENCLLAVNCTAEHYEEHP